MFSFVDGVGEFCLFLFAFLEDVFQFSVRFPFWIKSTNTLRHCSVLSIQNHVLWKLYIVPTVNKADTGHLHLCL